MNESEAVEIVGANGRRLSLRLVRTKDFDHVWAFEARLILEAGQAFSTIYDMGDGLADFFADLSRSWRGWDGTKEYRSLEGQLGMTASHDGLGTVSCEVILGQPWPPEWDVRAVLDFGAGADLEDKHDAIAAFVQSSRWRAENEEPA